MGSEKREDQQQNSGTAQPKTHLVSVGKEFIDYAHAEAEKTIAENVKRFLAARESKK